jgi:putative toxin-antitoxin system antitoxin component (TIGR02293 family)
MKKAFYRRKAVTPKKGVVQYWLHHSSGPDYAPYELHDLVHMGLPLRELEDLQASLRMPMDKLVPKLAMSKATYHRRKASGKLDPSESDRVVRFARLMGRAVEVLESEDNARAWLNSPQIGLGGAVPLDYAETELGAREVEDLLGRLEHGVYS